MMSTSTKTKDNTTALEAAVWQALATVIDPELQVDIVSLGLIYEVTEFSTPVGTSATPLNTTISQVHVVMTLTTPGCPLAAVFDTMVREAVVIAVPELAEDQQLSIELTFDPPWTPEMMSEEARAELGFD